MNLQPFSQLHPLRWALWFTLLLLSLREKALHLRGQPGPGVFRKVLGVVLGNAPQLHVGLGDHVEERGVFKDADARLRISVVCVLVFGYGKILLKVLSSL